jgi:hypothetical protein
MHICDQAETREAILESMLAFQQVFEGCQVQQDAHTHHAVDPQGQGL